MTTGAAFRESTTLKFVTVAFIPVFLRYLFGGFDTPFGSVPVMSATEFATAFAAITAVWLAREWRKDHYAK
jgi:hypothetical protein